MYGGSRFYTWFAIIFGARMAELGLVRILVALDFIVGFLYLLWLDLQDLIIYPIHSRENRRRWDIIMLRLLLNDFNLGLLRYLLLMRLTGYFCRPC